MANKFTTIDQLRQLAVRCLAAINGKVEEVAQDTSEAIGGLLARFEQHTGNHAPADAEKNVQSDWSVTDTSSDAFIKNKPAIPEVPDWAKQANKPTYTASEVGARPSSWTPTAADVGASPTGHKHTKAEITDFPTSMPPTEHNHDDRYYTESETD
jgi:hypothetical protein